MKSPNITVATFVGFTNRGAEALLRSRIGSIKKYIPSATFNVLTIYGDSCQPIDDVKYIQTFGGQREKLRSLSYLMAASHNSFIWTLEAFRYRLIGKTNHPDIKKLANSDLFMSSDGDVLGEDYGLLPYLWRLYYLSLGFILKKPVVIYAEGVGPFKSWVSKMISRWFFGKCNYISTRDRISYNNLISLGIDKKKIDVVADSAFLLEPARDLMVNYRRPGNILVGISVSKLATQYGFKYKNSKDSYTGFLQFMSEVIDWLVEEFGASIILIPHVIQVERDDFETAKDILDLLRYKDKVKIVGEELNAMQLKAVVSQCDLLIASRMHAAIAGLSSGVPVIGIAYSHKMHGVLSELGLKSIIDVQQLDWNITKTITETLKERDKIKKHLEVNLPRIQHLAEFPARQVFKILSLK